MNDVDFLRPLARLYLALTALCLLGGGAVALLASNESWRTAGAGFAIIGTPFGLLFTALVWIVDRCMG